MSRPAWWGGSGNQGLPEFRSCVELLGPLALFSPASRPHCCWLFSVLKVGGQGTELSNLCPTHLLSKEVPKASNLPSGTIDMRESLDVKVPLMTLCLEGMQKDVIPSPKEASKNTLKYLKNTLNFLIEKFVGSRLFLFLFGKRYECVLLIASVGRCILVFSSTLRSANVKQSYWTGLVLFGFSYEIW